MAKKIVEYQVLVTVEDEGEFDPKFLREAIDRGITTAVEEGASTALEDETTSTLHWGVKHISTKDC